MLSKVIYSCRVEVISNLYPVRDLNDQNLLRDSNKGGNLGVVKKPQSLTETLEMIDANNLSKLNNLWLDTML